MEATEKLCPDCGESMVKDSLGIWKCPSGCGEWLRNEIEQNRPKIKIEVRFQPLGGELPLQWRTAEKPVLQNGPIALHRSSNGGRKKRKKYKPIKGFQPWQLV